MQLSAIFLISPVFIHLSVKELWVCDPPVGKARAFLPGKAWLVGLAVLLQLGRSWGMDCCYQQISASVIDWIDLGSPGLTGSTVVSTSGSPVVPWWGNETVERLLWEAQVCLLSCPWGSQSQLQSASREPAPESSTVREVRDEGIAVSALVGSIDVILPLGCRVRCHWRSKWYQTLTPPKSVQDLPGRSDLQWWLIPRNKGGKRQQWGKGDRDAVGNCWPFKTSYKVSLLLQRWACYKLPNGQTAAEMQENGA